jgi:hypothetical protein
MTETDITRLCRGPQSGWGCEMGHEALEAYTEVKAVTTQL